VFKTCSYGLMVVIGCLVLIMLCFGMILVVFEYEQGRNSAIFAQASHSRLSENCRNSFLVFGSSVSLRRPKFMLSDTLTRSGENGSPKRGRDETCHVFRRILVQARDCVFGRMRVSLRREGLA